VLAVSEVIVPSMDTCTVTEALVDASRVGEWQRSWVDDIKLVEVDSEELNIHFSPVINIKFDPVIVIGLPPKGGPELGFKPYTLIGCV